MTQAIVITTSMREAYLKTFVSRTFKILPLFEENNDGLERYISSLMLEFQGFASLVEDEAEYVQLMSTLRAIWFEIRTPFANAEVVKREVFKCITVIKRLNTATESG